MLGVVIGTGIGATFIAEGIARALIDAGLSRTRFLSDQPFTGPLFANSLIEQVPMGDARAIARNLAGAEDLLLVPTLDEILVARKLVILDAAQQAGVKRVTLVSLIGSQVQSPIRLLSRFGMLEREVKSRGFEYTILQSAPLMQALVIFACDAQFCGLIKAPFRDARFPWVDARDLGRAAGVLAQRRAHHGSTYQITGAAVFGLQEVADRFANTLGQPIAYQDICMHEARGLLERMGVSPNRVQTVTEWWDALVSGLVPLQVSNDLGTVAGFAPCGLDAFIADHLNLMTAEPAH